MQRNRNSLRVLLAASAVLLAGAAGGPANAQKTPMDYDAAVPCQAFQRAGNGGWTAVAPVTLNIDNGMVLSFRPGDSMGPGSTIAGVAVPIILDRHCGNL
jgi:hypothetical protein